MNTNPSKQKESAEASDVEQAAGHGGNLRDAGPVAEPTSVQRDVGSSGHVPLAEELGLDVGATSTGSPGADADRGA